MEIVVIGGIAAGMSVASKARRTDPNAVITVFEKEEYVSFGACGLPYFVGEEFEDPNEMFARTPQQIRNSGIQLFTKHQVQSVDVANKVVKGINLENDETFVKSYDRLMIATGAVPVVPPVAGTEADNVYTLTKLRDAKSLKRHLSDYRRIAVIGGGFIGLEIADQLAKLGKEVTIIEGAERIMNRAVDAELSEKIQAAIEEAGVSVHLNEMLTGMQMDSQNQVTNVLTTTKNIEADAVILSIGFKPNTSFLKDVGLEMLPNGAILIDSYGQTSIQDVYSAGDCATIYHRQLGNVYLPLATGANKMGRLIGTNIVSDKEDQLAYSGSLGSSSIKVGDYEAGGTGLTEEQAKMLDMDYKTVFVETTNHSNYYPDQEPLFIKLIYAADTKILLGAQVFGKSQAVLRLTGLTTAIHAGLTTSDLGFIDYAYAPPFASTWEAINVAANVAK